MIFLLCLSRMIVLFVWKMCLFGGLYFIFLFLCLIVMIIMLLFLRNFMLWKVWLIIFDFGRMRILFSLRFMDVFFERILKSLEVEGCRIMCVICWVLLIVGVMMWLVLVCFSLDLVVICFVWVMIWILG